jgi:hypothetical protein
VAEIGHELHGAFETLGDGGILGALRFEFEEIEDLLTRCEEPAEGIGKREGNGLALSVIELVSERVGGLLEVIVAPEPHLHRCCKGAGTGAGLLSGNHAHLDDPCLELREEERIRHGDGEIAALDGFGTFVGGLELRIHPLVGEEAGAIFGDTVATHETDGFAQVDGANACVP